jgi:exopolysaccharide biosynthesis polyprenyl glycosylphosphotransferase
VQRELGAVTVTAEPTWSRDPGIIDVTPPTGARDPIGSATLRRLLMVGDAAAIASAWWLTFRIFGRATEIGTTTAKVAAMTVVGVCLLTWAQLYLARVATMRTIEIARLARASLALGITSVLLERLIRGDIRFSVVFVGSVLSLLGLVAWRTLYRSWLKAQRARGRFCRPVVLVGLDDQTRELHELLEEHADLGFTIVGAIGDRAAADRIGLGHIWLGHVGQAVQLAHEQVATGAILSTTALNPDTLNRLVRSLLESGCHVHLGTGLRGIDYRRLRPMHMAYEPMFYVEPSGLTRTQLVSKRALDLVVSTVALVASLPVLAVAAVAIKLNDRGPVLFTQCRVGRDGKLFNVYKLRTMSLDAEERLAEFAELNERNGPLFKMVEDPRVTRIGRLIRDLSIDELPQLWNVLKGDMSLVGPRPALPREAAVFGERLQSRTRVMPGITGLWQVEARDNPSFRAYERLDIFYVENWSLTLDLIILLSTVESEIGRVFRRIILRREARSAPAMTLVPTDAEA